MVNSSTSELNPAGLALFFGSESFLKDLSEADEAIVTGGKRSNSSRPKRKRRVKRRKRRVRNRSNSNSRS